MHESATRRKRKRSITVEPSCIFDTSPSPSQRAYNLRSSRRDNATRTSRSPSCPPIAYIDVVASEDVEGKNDISVAVEDEDGPLVDELASPKDSDPLTLEAFLQRSSAARTKTYRGRHKRRRVHFAESDLDYAPPADDAGEAEDQLGLAAGDQPDADDEPPALLASSLPGSPASAPPRKKKPLSHRLTIAALECGGTIPVDPELPTTPPRIPLTFVAANGTTKPPKRPRKTGHLVDPRRRAGFGRSTSHFRAAAAQRAANAASPSRPAPASSSTAAPRSKYRANWRTHAPPMLPKAYFPSCAAESILPPPGKKPHRRQPAQLSDTVPLKLVPLEESVVGAKAKVATGRPGRRMARKKDAVLTGPGPLTFVSVLTRKAPTASSSLPATGPASSPAPTFCMTSVRDRLLGTRQPPIAADTENGIEETQDHNSAAISDPVDAENPLYAGSASPFSSNVNAASKPASTSTSKQAPSSISKHTLASGSEPAPFSAFKMPIYTNTKTPLRINAHTILPTNANTKLPSSTKPLKPLAAFHDRLAETVRTASQLVDAATGVLRTPEGGSQRRKRASEVSGRKAARVSLSDRRGESSTRNSGDTCSTRLRMSSTRHSKIRSYQPSITSMLAPSARPPDVSGARPSLALYPRPIEIRSPKVTSRRSSPVYHRSRSPRPSRACPIDSPPAHSPTNPLPRSPHPSRPQPSHISRQPEDQNRVCIDLCSSSPLLAAAARSGLSSLPALSSSPALPINMGPPPAQATTSYSPLPTTASRMSPSRYGSSQAIRSSPDGSLPSIQRDAAPVPPSHPLPAIAQLANDLDPSSDSIQSSSPSFVMHSVRRLQSRSTTAREGLEVVWR